MLFLAIQSTYDAVELGLFQKDGCIEQRSISKIDASSQLIPTLDSLLRHHNVSYNDLSFCAVSQGPGPFTTLRTVIATMNGLAYATGIPLVGVNALGALIQEYDPQNSLNVCAVLQAFSGDLYMGLRFAGSCDVQIGVIPAKNLAEYLATLQMQVQVIGNGALLCSDAFEPNESIVVNTTTFLHSSLSAIANQGLELWQKKDRASLSLRPLYLKNHPAQQK